MVVKSEQRNLVQCTVVGDGMVGKSSLSLAFTNEPPKGDYIATVFENYAGKTNVAGDEYTVGIFDSAGQVIIVVYILWGFFINEPIRPKVHLNVCSQQRFRSACAFAQFDQNQYAHFGSPRMQSFFMRTNNGDANQTARMRRLI